MKFALAFAAAVLPLTACNFANGMSGDVVEPSGSGGTRTFQVADFTGVSLRGSDDIEVKTGAKFSVTASGDADLLDKLEVRKDGDVLRVGRKDSAWNWGGDKRARFTITMPKLVKAGVAGSGNMTADRGEGDFDGAISGSGNLTIGELRAGKTELSISGSGNMRITGGQASAIDASIAGSGDIDAAGLKAQHGEFSIAGSGDARAQVSGEADISIVGSGNVELTGGAKCSVSKMGSGEARCS